MIGYSMRLAVFLITLAMILGCGKTNTAPEGGPPASTYFTDLKFLLEQFEKDKKRAPARMSDVMEYEPSYPGAVRKLNTGDVIYAWGNPLGSGTGILAYGRNVGTEGGPVLLQDGTVKDMTANEFATAPKVTKK